MELQVNGSSSRGNQYLLITPDGILAIEAGIPLREVKKALNFDLSGIVGCLLSHCHSDHAKYAKEYSKAGIDVYATNGTLTEIGLNSHRTHLIEYLYINRHNLSQKSFNVGCFKILAFEIKHDAPEPVGFLINYLGENVLFLTDSWFCPFRFKGLTNVIVEANYDEDILSENLSTGVIHQKVFNRVKESHMELKVLKTLLLANDLTNVNNIVLIHLSSANSDANRFQKEITELTGKNVHVAKAGMRIPFNRTPF